MCLRLNRCESKMASFYIFCFMQVNKEDGNGRARLRCAAFKCQSAAGIQPIWGKMSVPLFESKALTAFRIQR